MTVGSDSPGDLQGDVSINYSRDEGGANEAAAEAR